MTRIQIVVDTRNGTILGACADAQAAKRLCDHTGHAFTRVSDEPVLTGGAPPRQPLRRVCVLVDTNRDRLRGCYIHGVYQDYAAAQAHYDTLFDSAEYANKRFLRITDEPVLQ